MTNVRQMTGRGVGGEGVMSELGSIVFTLNFCFHIVPSFSLFLWLFSTYCSKFLVLFILNLPKNHCTWGW